MSIEKTFPSIESKISKFPTFLLQALLYGLLLFCFVILFLLPIYGVYKRGIGVMFYPASFCIFFALLILIPSIKHYIINRNRLSSKIIINETGLLYYNQKCEIVNKILYTDLISSGKDFDVTAVNTRTSGIMSLLEIFTASEKGDIAASRIEMNLPLYVVGNRYTLYAHFLKGITLFRPDLKIDERVFLTYFIDPKTWQINRKSSIYLFLILILAALLVSGLILWLVFAFT